tara:strand:+ start:299 stop:733 length:435 start_codon:yes stop_codon:yes gene_type:complete
MHLHQLELKDLDFWISLPIMWDNLDALGHFNCNVLLFYVESVSVDTYAQLEFEVINKRSDNTIILDNIEVTYLALLMIPSSLKIDNGIAQVGTKSYDLIPGIFLQPVSALLCSAYFKLVSFNYENNMIILVPNKIKKNCRPLAK